ncbi:SF1-like, partial [Ictidomys tridecemlineatus]|uniref:Splicing factor 1 n=1 Tax=Ictidomys tridecemlineatus TaxID=43179 RepID=A0A287CX92_ICTTR
CGRGWKASDFPSKKRKRSRWNQDTMEQKTVIPGMPTVIPPGLTREQERPIYNSEGKQLNTREFRTRKKLEEERHNLITEMVALNPDFKPPADYKPPATRVSDKVMIPQDEYPEINFVGLLIGPRGNTVKNIEKECNAKIMIWGKGSVKEGMVGRKDGQMLPGEDEPLHALVTANTMENVKKAVEQIRNILKQGIETPEDQNDLRKMQLRELARLNGTLREDDNRILRPWQSSETRSITNTTVCTKCGGAGHIASDCKFQRPGDPQSAQDKARMDKEYLSLMAELGEAPVPASVGSTSWPATTPLASAPRPAAPANNPPPPSLMSTTQSRPPWMNSGPSESRPYHGMHGGGPGGPGGGPHRGHGGHPMQHNPNGPPPPWMQPPPPRMNQGPHPPGHRGPPPMDQYLGSTPVGSGVYRLHQGKGMMPPPPMGMMPPPPPPPSGHPPPPPSGPLPPWQQQPPQQPPPPPPPSSSMASSTPLPWHPTGPWLMSPGLPSPGLCPCPCPLISGPLLAPPPVPPPCSPCAVVSWHIPDPQLPLLLPSLGSSNGCWLPTNTPPIQDQRYPSQCPTLSLVWSWSLSGDLLTQGRGVEFLAGLWALKAPYGKHSPAPCLEPLR